MGVFVQLFQSNISQCIHKLQAPYLCQSDANYLVFHTSKNTAIIKTLTSIFSSIWDWRESRNRVSKNAWWISQFGKNQLEMK